MTSHAQAIIPRRHRFTSGRDTQNRRDRPGAHSQRGLVGQPDGGLLLRAEGRGSDAEALGVQVAEQLLAQGAEAILKAVYGEAAAE